MTKTIRQILLGMTIRQALKTLYISDDLNTIHYVCLLEILDDLSKWSEYTNSWKQAMENQAMIQIGNDEKTSNEETSNDDKGL